MDSYHSSYGRPSPSLYLPSLTPVVKMLIWINVGVFLLELIIGERGLADTFRIFGLVPAYLMRGCIWQLVTYAFLHDGIMHILLNMLALYFFAGDLERMYGRRQFVYLYLAAAAFGGLAHCLVVWLVRGDVVAMRRAVVGASGAIMAVMVLFAINFPNRLVIFWFIPMRARTLALIMIGINLFYALRGLGGRVAVLVHLGGAAYGLLYWRFGGVFAGFLGNMKYTLEKRRADQEANDEERINELLDKISREGMDSLTRSERAFLVRASRKRTDRRP